MKLRALAVTTLCLLTFASLAESRAPRVTLASLAMDDWAMPDPSGQLRIDPKGTPPSELAVHVRQPTTDKSKVVRTEDYYAGNGYTTTTVKAAASDVCLSSSAGNAVREDQRDKIVLYARAGRDPLGALHAERVLVEGRTAYLHTRSYWLDAGRGQLELLKDRKVKLTPVASRGELVTVYAYRTPRDLLLVLRTQANAATITANGGVARLGCGIKKLTFPLAEQPDLALSFALGLPEKDPRPGDDFHSSQPLPLGEALRVSASISQTSRDPAPVLSVTIAPTNRGIRATLAQSMPRWSEVLNSEELARLDGSARVEKRRR